MPHEMEMRPALAVDEDGRIVKKVYLEDNDEITLDTELPEEGWEFDEVQYYSRGYVPAGVEKRLKPLNRIAVYLVHPELGRLPFGENVAVHYLRNHESFGAYGMAVARLRAILSARCFFKNERREQVDPQRCEATLREGRWHVVLRDHEGGEMRRVVERGRRRGQTAWRVDRQSGGGHEAA